MRRVLDILISAIALVVLAPLVMLVAILIRVLDGAPVLFFQYRAGLHMVPFRMIKFRTMRPDAEKCGGSLTFREDKRIMRLGRFLRRCKLDELPQLFNVLRGEMTLIGPRPEVLDWAKRFSSEEREVFSVKPGLSDPVQIFFRHEQDHLQNEREYRKLVTIKIGRQIEYLRSRTAISDVATVLATLRVLFPGKPSADELAVYSAIRAEVAAENRGSSL